MKWEYDWPMTDQRVMCCRLVEKVCVGVPEWRRR